MAKNKHLFMHPETAHDEIVARVDVLRKRAEWAVKESAGLDQQATKLRDDATSMRTIAAQYEALIANSR